MSHREDPSPLWSLHCALDEFMEACNEEPPDDLVIIVGVELLTYMRRLYRTADFSVRGYPVISEILCPTRRILFLSMNDYLRARRAPEFWR